MAQKGNNQQRFASKDDTNPGNIQQGKQQGHNTGKGAAKSNVKLQSRNDPGFPKTTGPEKKEMKEGFKKRK